jgi:DNA helicase-2/ATP-dependent DNA helicase PcrA
MHHALPADRPYSSVPPASSRRAEELTPDQRAAVEHGRGPLMVFAGPGAGKTRTITHRIAHLLATERARPAQILAVTFTVAAAAQMRGRLAQMLGIDAIGGLTVATFHSVCARLLRTHADCFGRGADYTIYDQNDLAKVVVHLLSDARRGAVRSQLDVLGAVGPDRRVAAAQIVEEISLAKNRLWTPDHYREHSRHPLAALIAAVWTEAEAELRASSAFDFDDLLVYGVRLLAEYPQLLAHYRSRWRWMLVDEFQDTNFAQMALVSLIAGPNGNVTVVADDDQSIYAFRGSNCSENVLRFGDWFPGFRAITLGRNYRSRAEILAVAVNCVQHNRDRVHKQLVAIRGGGGRIETPVFGNEHQEAHFVTGLVIEALGAGVGPDDILLIARNGYLTVALQQALAANGVPYRVLGALGLFERAEVKDALAYLRLLSNPCDGEAFRRAIAAPKRGVGRATASRVIEHARDAHNGDLIAACGHVSDIDGVRQRARDALSQFGAHLHQVRRDLAKGRSVSHAVVSAVTMPGGLVAHHRHIAESADDGDVRRDAERVLEDLRSLCRAAVAYAEAAHGEPSVAGFLENACGLDGTHELDGDDVRVTISTIHRSKGMEATLVVLISCEERVLPSWRSLEDARQPGEVPSGGLEEERRLFYVAVTRTKDRLVITRSRMRGDRLTEGPSRFLTEAGLI